MLRVLIYRCIYNRDRLFKLIGIFFLLDFFLEWVVKLGLFFVKIIKL